MQVKNPAGTAMTSRHLVAWFFATVSVASVAAHVLVWRALAAFAAGVTPLGVILILAGIPAGIAGYFASSREPEYVVPGAVSLICLFVIILAWLAFGGFLFFSPFSAGGA